MLGDKETALAVDGQGLYFYFDRKRKVPILNDASFAVTQGAIYSLLGPSGCGKTTLLKCVIGQHKIQRGSLKVYGSIPGSKGFPIPGRGVGYMPQDLALYSEMSIGEIMVYFGSLYGMKRTLIDERISFLVELLALPEKRRMIKHLSGGQQRRVSFAVALIHKPPLLILDEPTVGVDPLLRQTIWDHLVSLVKSERLTIIITTHYTEEARQADIVGLMRNGHLLVEKNPEDLIKQYGVMSLEEVFLKLCQNTRDEDDYHETPQSLTTVESHNPNCLTERVVLNGKEANERYAEEKHLEGNHLAQNGTDFAMIAMDPADKYDESDVKNENDLQDNTRALLTPPSPPKELDHPDAISAILASWLRFICLTRKNIIRLKRNVFMMGFSVFVPTFEIFVFCVCLSSNPFDLNVAVVNLDEDVNRYGDYYLRTVNNHTINQVKYDNLDAAYESVKRGESKAAIYIGQEFSPCVVDRILEGADASNDTLRCSMVHMYLDNSNYVVATTVYVALLESYIKFAGLLLNQYGKSSLIADPPVTIEKFVYGSPTATVIEFTAPAVILAVTYIIAIALTALSLIEEEKQGLFERSIVAGATAGEMLMSFFVVMLIILVLQVIVMLAFAFFVFHIPYNGSLFWIFFGTFSVGVSGMSYGLLVSTLTDDVATAVVVIVGTFFPTIFLSGIIWPTEAMPYYVRYFSYCLPLTKLIETMRSIMTRGWGITDYYIWDGYLICSTWTILGIILSITVLRLKI